MKAKAQAHAPRAAAPRSAAPAAARTGSSNVVAPGVERAPLRTACACGGGCPRCRQTPLRVLPAQTGEEGRAAAAANAVLLGRRGPSWAPADRPEAIDLGPGEPLDAASRAFFEPRFGQPLGAVRVHAGASADRRARAVGAAAFSQGMHIGFRSGHHAPGREGGRALLAHELAHVLGPQRSPHRLHRHPVATTTLARRTRVELFGDGTPAHTGIDVDAFDAYSREQADWFAESTLGAADRDLLWALMLRLLNGPQVAAGVGDLKLADLVGRTPADWAALDAFGRTREPSQHTVRVSRASAYTAEQRIAMGNALISLEALHNITGAVLEITVSELQLADVASGALLPAITDYWTRFHPFLQSPFNPGAGARGPEFQKVLDLLAGPGGITPLLPLRGRIRNLHRFSRVMLTRLVSNFADFSRSRPVQLILHTGHDSNAFQESAALFEDLVLQTRPAGLAGLGYDDRLVLMLEGGETLVAMTAQVNAITRDHGERDARGVARLEQVMLAGHGSARSVGMAGAGPPRVHEGTVEYDDHSQGINLDTANSAEVLDLIDALLTNLDPATARLVFAGCLVGSNPVPEGTPTADIAAHIAAHPNLASVVESRGRALGLPRGFVAAARASVGLASASSLRAADGGLAIDYGYDRAAFGTAANYAATGMEPEGVLVAAVEVAGGGGAPAGAAGPMAAAAALRARLALAARPADWYDTVTRAAVTVALDGTPAGAPLDVARTNTLAHLIQVPYLSHWSSYGIGVAHFMHRVNNHPALASGLYTALSASPMFTAPPELDQRWMRLVMEQGWLHAGGAREASLRAFLDAQPTLTQSLIAMRLHRPALAGHEATLFPPAGPFSNGRLRLALAWSGQDAAQTDVQAFLMTQVVHGAGAPTLTAALAAELDGLHPNTLLVRLGVPLGPVVAPAAPGAAPLPAANAEVTGDRRNDVLVEQQPHEASVLPFALNVRRQPWMGANVIATVARGATVRVVGFTHDWAAIQHGGRLGFVYRTQLTPPP